MSTSGVITMGSMWVMLSSSVSEVVVCSIGVVVSPLAVVVVSVVVVGSAWRVDRTYEVGGEKENVVDGDSECCEGCLLNV